MDGDCFTCALCDRETMMSNVVCLHCHDAEIKALCTERDELRELVRRATLLANLGDAQAWYKDARAALERGRKGADR